MNIPSLKQPSALIPLAMSLAALALLLGYVAVVGNVHNTDVGNHDEGPLARIFQLLLVLQLPIIAFFAIKWLPRAPKQALMIMALQAGAGLTAIATVLFLERGT